MTGSRRTRLDREIVYKDKEMKKDKGKILDMATRETANPRVEKWLLDEIRIAMKEKTGTLPSAAAATQECIESWADQNGLNVAELRKKREKASA